MSDENGAFISGIQSLIFIGFALYLLLIYPIILFVKAYKRQVVIFYDIGDIIATILIPIFLIFALIPINYTVMEPLSSSNSLPWITSFILGAGLAIAALILFFRNFSSATKHSRNFIEGVAIGFYKFGFALLAILLLPLLILNWWAVKSDPSINYTAKLASKGLPAFYLIIINGEETYQANGWELPSEETKTEKS